MDPLPQPRSRYRLRWRDDRYVAVARDGEVAWSIVDKERWLPPLGPVAVPGGLVLTTENGLLVALDYV
jgi:hypothetical protein